MLKNLLIQSECLACNDLTSDRDLTRGSISKEAGVKLLADLGPGEQKRWASKAALPLWLIIHNTVQ